MSEHRSYRVLGVGAACIDLLLPVSEEFLARIPGEKGGAQSLDLEEINKIIFESQTVPHIATGGSCANAIKGLANFGEKCALLSHIGSDALGEHFTQYMKKLGIITLFSKSRQPTARVLCLLTPDGQRTMRFYTGCTQEMADRFLDPDYFQGVKLVHLDAYTLRNGNLTQRVMQLARQASAKVSIDLSSFEIIRDYHATLMELLPRYVDIVFANADEAKALTGLSPLEGCIKLQEMCSIAVVLMGKEGCLVGHQGTTFQSPAFPAQLVDTTGAGDLFASGFLFGYLNDYPLTKCAQLGNRLGGAVVEVQGAELPPEKWEIIRAALFKNHTIEMPTCSKTGLKEA